MLTGRTYEDVLASVGDTLDPERGMRRDQEALRRLGFSSQYENGEPVGDFVCRNRGPLSPEFFRHFAWGRRALMSVPSLNNPGGWHMVYTVGAKVFDPSSLKTYTAWAELRPDDITLFREVA